MKHKPTNVGRIALKRRRGQFNLDGASLRNGCKKVNPLGFVGSPTDQPLSYPDEQIRISFPVHERAVQPPSGTPG